MKAEILAVGTELLLGQIVNTNAQFLARELSLLGIDVYFQTVVGDNRGRLVSALENAFARADCVVMTGGLGPTKDDLTKETVAEYFGLTLVPHEESMSRLKAFFENLGREMTENNKKQGMLPEGCTVLQNDNGTAPGCLIEKDGKIAVLMPGPPREMQPMFLRYAAPLLQSHSTGAIYSRTLRIFGVGESAAEQTIADIIEVQSNPTIAPYAKEGEMEFRLSAKCATAEEAESLLTPVEQEIRRRLGSAVYSNDGSYLSELVVRLLKERGQTIAVAESCTGGLVGNMLTEVAGASAVFLCGYITYANEAKVKLLGVRRETLERCGAVSAETAEEMARGAREASGADIAVSITGIAGPDGGSAEKPVGLVYVGLAWADGVSHTELRLFGDRNRIRHMGALNALNLMRLHCQALPQDAAIN